MTRILFVCHGNICRSPMAEIIFRDMVQKAGAQDRFVIASAATSREEIINGIGNPVYSPARAELARHGLSCGDKRAVLLQKNDYGRYDRIFGMDQQNMRNMLRIFGGDPERKCRRLMELTEQGGDVDDPWYSGDFAAAYRDIYAGCAALLQALEGEKPFPRGRS